MTLDEWISKHAPYLNEDIKTTIATLCDTLPPEEQAELLRLIMTSVRSRLVRGKMKEENFRIFKETIFLKDLFEMLTRDLKELPELRKVAALGVIKVRELQELLTPEMKLQGVPPRGKS